MYDTIVVGGGMAGLTAAAYLAKAKKKVLLLEKEPHVGGLVNSFKYDGFTIDGGLRSIENSGTVFPMLKELGIDIPFKRSIVSIGIGDDYIKVESKESLAAYTEMLKKHFPENKRDVDRIIQEIKVIMKYMDVLYGIDNPVFSKMKNPKYFLGTVLPWSFKFIETLPKINALDIPMNEFLATFTDNQRLIDVITQHFFKKTPASFALSYFSLYLDYYYPEGGTNVLPAAMEKYILSHGGEIKKNTEVIEILPTRRQVKTKDGAVLNYNKMIWAADQKLLYNLSNHPYRHELKKCVGGDSSFSVYATFDIAPEDLPATEHMFYTPNNQGIGNIEKEIPNLETKTEIKEWIHNYLKNNTFEISIPAKRFDNLAPEGKSAIMISTLFSYQLTEKIYQMGWYEEFKHFVEEEIIDILDQSFYKGIKQKLLNKRSATPYTLKRYTNNSEGAMTGWSFDNPFMPAETSITAGSKPVMTKIDHVFQAGAWVYSPSGVPTAIMMGKVAAKEVIKRTRRLF